MFIFGSALFWIIIVLGFLCGLGMILVSLWYTKLKEVTFRQTTLFQVLFYGFFAGVLLFLATPLFYLLLFL